MARSNRSVADFGPERDRNSRSRRTDEDGEGVTGKFKIINLPNTMLRQLIQKERVSEGNSNNQIIGSPAPVDSRVNEGPLFTSDHG